MIAFLNVGSLLFGLLAWIVPVAGIGRYSKIDGKNKVYFSAFSFSACAVSLCMQIFEINERVKLQDWSALMDTSGSLVKVCTVLVVVTILLNLFALAVFQEK